jgi:hypothetical protein
LEVTFGPPEAPSDPHVEIAHPEEARFEAPASRVMQTHEDVAKISDDRGRAPEPVSTMLADELEPAPAVAVPRPKEATPAQVPVKAPPRPTKPRKPGYVTRGTVEPVLVGGILALALAVGLVGLGALVSSRALAIAGLGFGAIGSIAVVVSLLIALVRREGNR